MTLNIAKKIAFFTRRHTILFTVFVLALYLNASLVWAQSPTPEAPGINAQNLNEQQRQAFSKSLRQKPAWVELQKVAQSSVVVANGANQIWFEHRAKAPMIPASTAKIVTALLALQHWGAQHRFETEFYLQQANPSQVHAQPNSATAVTLTVKGKGDPLLVSEEVQRMALTVAQKLKQKGIQQIDVLALDAGFYATNLEMPDLGTTHNPYDAMPTALAVNFNTVFVKRINGKWASAEAQTPLTPTAIKVAEAQSIVGQKRVNIGHQQTLAVANFGEVLQAMLAKQGIKVNAQKQIDTSQASFASKLKPKSLFYRHKNSQSLAQVIRLMLTYSTNFIANQLALNLAVETMGAPANHKKLIATLNALLEKKFAWQEFHLEDGSGLSRQNRLSAQQLLEVLQAWQPWQHLLPQIEPGIWAKTGTLKGVSTLAGFISPAKQRLHGSLQQKTYEPLKFVILMNQPVPYRLRIRLVQALQDVLTKLVAG